MARAQVALVQGDVFVAAFGRQHPRHHVGVAREAAALAAAGAEAGDGDAHRDAGAATAAMRAVDDAAGTAEAPAQRDRVGLRQARVARVDDQVAGDAFGEIPADVVAGMEHAQLFGFAHERSLAPRGRAGRDGQPPRRRGVDRGRLHPLPPRGSR